jgi:hypothetical protein
MYGWINDAIEKLIVFRYGEENWAKIKAFGQCDVDQWVINREYPDYLTDNLITAACEHLKEEPIDRDSFLVELGEFFLLYVR